MPGEAGGCGAERGARILEENHMVAILQFVGRHRGCRRNHIYLGVSRIGTMSGKIDTLVDAGLLVETEVSPGRFRYSLTPAGELVVWHLDAIDALMAPCGEGEENGSSDV